MKCEGNYETCPCDDCEAVRISPRPSVDEDGIWLPQPISRSVGKVSSNDREQLIANGFVSLRQAEVVIAQAKVTP